MPTPPNSERDRPQTAADLHLMEETPPPPDRLVTLENWQEPPYNRWGFQHVRDLIPTARIGRGDRVWELERDERELLPAETADGSRGLEFDRMLEDTYTDGLLVLHRGRIVYERYLNGLTPDTTHLIMSVSKSITSTLVGSLVDDGRLRPADLVTDHLPELAGTSFDGCTVRDLLDMRAGTRFDEDYDNLEADVRVYEEICLWRPRTRSDIPPDLCSYYATLENDGPHGGEFRYRSILTDVLGWVAERAGGGRFADLVSDRVWRPLGAEFDAEVTVDGHGNAMADGGVCCTLRDLARFGQMMLAGGVGGSGRVISQRWIDDILSGEPDLVAAFEGSDDASDFPPGAYYHNKWWVVDSARPLYAGLGINGQMVLVDGAAQAVVAKLSTWPEAWSGERFGATMRAVRDLLGQLPGSSA
jgi:CubicO group peptidase (beta-lactamase class C family)